MDLCIGKVVSIEGRKVRVYYPDTDTVSDWLTVVQMPPSVSGEGISVASWMPNVNSFVLCAFLPGFNADGFVIGGL
ncbi:MAG: hypothetical protein IJK23_09985 [Clostridia bacterium]|nr:hypothetical protein [Clostridia bacterium]